VRLPRSPLGLAGFSLLAVLLGLAAWTEFTHAASLSTGSDMDAYWNAALRLRAHGTLYAPGLPTDSDLYRYAPWFAFAWIPLTFLPKGVVLLSWMTICLGAAIGSVAPLLWRGWVGIALFALLLPFQLEGAAFGNVQPILVLLLMWGVGRRSGPVWIAIAASLKATPILLAAVYVGRGEWRRAWAAGGLAAVLVVPMLFFDLHGYSTDIGGGQQSLLLVSPFIWLPVTLAAIGATLQLARTRYAWLAGTVAMILALPRFLLYEIGFVLVGLANDQGSHPERQPPPGAV
jgi:hypothetical protein